MFSFSRILNSVVSLFFSPSTLKLRRVNLQWFFKVWNRFWIGNSSKLSISEKVLSKNVSSSFLNILLVYHAHAPGISQSPLEKYSKNKLCAIMLQFIKIIFVEKYWEMKKDIFLLRTFSDIKWFSRNRVISIDRYT